MISAKHETLFDVLALKKERNTWRLIGRLYHDELMQAQNTNDSIANTDNSTSEKEIIEHAFTADRKLRRAQVIVDWLEYNDRKDLEELQINVPHQATTGFENTLATLMHTVSFD